MKRPKWAEGHDAFAAHAGVRLLVDALTHGELQIQMARYSSEPMEHLDFHESPPRGWEWTAVVLPREKAQAVVKLFGRAQ